MKIIHKNKWQTKWKAVIKDAKTGKIKREIPFKNVILKQFRERINAFLYGSEDDGEKLHITHEKLGTDDTQADEDQTDLIAPDEGTKKIIGSLEYEDDKIVLLSFWDDGEAIGEWKEFALYANTNFAMVRANVDLNISAGETITIHGEIRQSI